MILAARDALDGTGCWIGAQDVHWASGAVTGGVSADLLAEIGVTLVEIGHAERRTLGETDGQIAKKVVAVLEAGLTPLLCVGELNYESAELAGAECCEQALAVVPEGRMAEVILAYEPWWAIGADEPADADHVNGVARHLRRLGPRAILYGGSAGPGTFGPLADVDGLFLGRFAHDPANLARVLDEALAR